MQVGRALILESLVKALEAEPYSLAMFENGSAAWGREDEWSDTDLNLFVEDDRVEDAFAVIERTLVSLSPIEAKWRVPEPAWHGFSQCFYQLRDAGPYLFVDFSVLRRSHGFKLPEIEPHGFARVLFDKVGMEPAAPAARKNSPARSAVLAGNGSAESSTSPLDKPPPDSEPALG